MPAPQSAFTSAPCMIASSHSSGHQWPFDNLQTSKSSLAMACTMRFVFSSASLATAKLQGTSGSRGGGFTSSACFARPPLP